MAKIQMVICALFGVIVAASALNIPSVHSESSSGNIDAVIVVDSIEEYVKSNPNVELIKMEKDIPALSARSFSPRTPIRYSMGARNGRDRLLTNGQNSYYYPTLQDVKLQLSYPQSGVGSIVTFVEIFVEQSSGNGNAYIVAGRIGERFIRVVIEAKQTSYFIYRAAFYGF